MALVFHDRCCVASWSVVVYGDEGMAGSLPAIMWLGGSMGSPQLYCIDDASLCLGARGLSIDNEETFLDLFAGSFGGMTT